jgi:hypothetical protein
MTQDVGIKAMPPIPLIRVAVSYDRNRMIVTEAGRQENVKRDSALVNAIACLLIEHHVQQGPGGQAYAPQIRG